MVLVQNLELFGHKTEIHATPSGDFWLSRSSPQFRRNDFARNGAMNVQAFEQSLPKRVACERWAGRNQSINPPSIGIQLTSIKKAGHCVEKEWVKFWPIVAVEHEMSPVLCRWKLPKLVFHSVWGLCCQ